METIVPTSAYEHALSFLYGRINYERGGNIPYRSRAFHLDRMRQLVERLGNPERGLKIIHVAGTKGKGSTSAMIAAALQRSGLRTGLYTSPHLDRLEERFVIDGACCTPDELIRLVERVEPVVSDIDREQCSRGGRGPTFFEITTAMGFLYFAQRAVDAVVMEVGLGGRLDSTNVCQPQITAITSISFDHTRQLGNTLAKIAREKAGILKPGVPAISGVLDQEPREVIRAIARQVPAPLYELGSDFHMRYHGPPVDELGNAQNVFATMDYYEQSASRASVFTNLRLGLLGEHQARNAGVAIATLLRLREQGWNISDESILAGLAAPICPARIEVAASNPIVIVDVAHNTASVAALVRVLDEVFPSRQRIIVLAVSEDKDVRGILQLLLPRCARMIVTRFCSNPRSVSPDELFRTVVQLAHELNAHPQVLVAEDPGAAWNLARAVARPEDLVCITGSFFLAAEMRSLVRR